MGSPSTISALDRSSVIAGLVEQLTARIQAGEQVDLQSFLDEHAEYADELCGLLPAMSLLVNLSRSCEHRGVSSTCDNSGELGDFRIIREVGRGGMGVVYEAEQISLGRRVALKVLPFAATMDPRHLQRFKNEAKAAGSLKHEHIVHVYGVGCERGVHYYAMEFVDGQTLAQVLGERVRVSAPTSESEKLGALTQPRSPETAPIAALTTKRDKTRYRAIAALIADAADALEHAHSLGIVHRDVKPGNLLLDNNGKIYVSDFGLARMASPGCEAGGLTMSGDLLGTLRYMAPEQALAKHDLADHRVDVYGLGCTLYELLTGKPAVRGEDKSEILKHIVFEEPTSLRKLDKSIPAELETITLKCLAKEPKERFASAGELAADLRRWLEDKPIKAKPPGLRERVVKSCKRYKYLAGAAAAVLIVITVASSLSTILIWNKNQQIQLANMAETRQRNQAEARLSFARELAGELYSDVTEKLLLVEPAMEDVQERFLRKSLEFFQRFANESELGPAGRRDRAHALNRIAIIYAKLGKFNEAGAALEQAIPLFRILLKENPENEKDRAGIALALHCLGTLPKATKRSTPPESSIREAIEQRKALVKDFPNKTEYRGALALSEARLGMLAYESGCFGDAESILKHVIADYEQIIADDPSPDQKNVLAGLLDNLAAIQAKQGNRADAIELFLRAIDIDLAVVAESPRARRPREYLANHYSKLASALAEGGKYGEAEIAIRRCIAQRELLIEDFPKTAPYRSMLADNRWVLAAILSAADRPEAESACRQAILSYKQLPGPPSTNRGNLAQAYDTLGQCLRHSEKFDEAAAAFAQALEIRKSSAQSVQYSATLYNSGLVRFDQGDVATAIRCTEESLQILRTLLQSQERDGTARRFFCIQSSALVTFLTDAPSPWRDYPRAIALAREALVVDPTNARVRFRLGRSLFRAGNCVAAISELEAALPGLQGDASDRIDAWFHLAMAYRQMGETMRSTLYLASAVRSLEADKLRKTVKKRLDALRDEATTVLGAKNSEGSSAEPSPRRP